MSVYPSYAQYAKDFPERTVVSEKEGNGYRFIIYANQQGWRIDIGPSQFLVAEGTDFSRPVGEQIFEKLVDGDLVWRTGKEKIY